MDGASSFSSLDLFPLLRARSLYLYRGRAIGWGSLMGCENLPHRGARFGIFKKVRIFATELAGILIS